MRYRFIRGHANEFPIGLMCKVLQVARSAFYAWRRRPASKTTVARTALVEKIRNIHGDSRQTYGSPRIHKELEARGTGCSVNHVAKVMRDNGICARMKRRFRKTTDSKHIHPVTANVLDRQFEQTSPDQAWSGDITYVATDEGWLYLAVVLDLYSRRVVGWAMSDRITSDLVESALIMAIDQRRPDPGLLHHSDRGSQYAAGDYQQLLSANNMRCSMSRKGNCWDNAVAESFFGTLKTELIAFERYATRAAARQSIFEYIEVFYNRKRRHSTIGYVSPVQYEAGFQPAA